MKDIGAATGVDGTYIGEMIKFFEKSPYISCPNHSACPEIPRDSSYLSGDEAECLYSQSPLHPLDEGQTGKDTQGRVSRSISSPFHSF